MGKNFTQEERADIQTSYRDAKNPDKQIGVLAELYACSKNDIRNALHLPFEHTSNKKRAINKYDPETKKAVLKAILLDEEPRADVAERFGVLRGTVDCWVSEAKRTQAEFMSYPEKTQAVSKADMDSDKNTVPVTVDSKILILEKEAEKIKKAANNFSLFLETFENVDAFESDELCRMQQFNDQAWAFVDGIDYAVRKLKEVQL